MEYHDGFPKQPGWYDVQINGVDERLLFRICKSYGRKEWMDTAGNRVKPEKVKWFGEPSANP